MYELLQEAQSEGMTFRLGEGEQIFVSGQWNTPTAKKLMDALRKQKPLVLAELRDLTAFVGETVRPDVLFILQRRASEAGWKLEARAVVGGAVITELRAPWDAGAELDPAKQYGIDAKTGQYVELKGDWLPTFRGQKMEVQHA